MPSEYYNHHAEELIKHAEKYEKSRFEHEKVRAQRIRALLKREFEKND